MAATAMDDLVASLGGSMHVSQEGYDLKALQEYLAQTMVRPSIPLSPNAPFRPIPPSRSTSLTRKPSSLPSSYSYPESSMSQAYPSPVSQSSYPSFPEDPSGLVFGLAAASPTGMARPGGQLRRSSSYGFGWGVNLNVNVNVAPASPSPGYSSFESDAFAPLWQEEEMAAHGQSQDPWAKMRGQPSNIGAFGHHFQSYPRASDEMTNHGGPSQPAMGFGSFRPAQGSGLAEQGFTVSPPTPPPEDDEEMDEDSVDAEMDEDDEEERVERTMGLDDPEGEGEGFGVDGHDLWGRGRRKL